MDESHGNLRGGIEREQGEVADFAKWKNFRDEPLNIVPHREKMVKRDLEKEFKKAEHPFRIGIVCAMWLTGFDVKCLARQADAGPSCQCRRTISSPPY